MSNEYELLFKINSREDNEETQRFLFAAGFSWFFGGKVVQYEEMDIVYLVVDYDDMMITYLERDESYEEYIEEGRLKWSPKLTRRSL